ncbi:hypothetical protein Syun_009269 [Stephania yunnanensis]|uniref:Uncharacterized protein n=1 Tax=Stephania yunnanensis TaxID=152371 RepID=A0AAP0KGU1_9MAGN
MVHASSSSSTPLLPLRRFAQKKKEKNNSATAVFDFFFFLFADSSSSSSHRDRRLRRFAERTRTKPSPLRRFADSPIRLLHRFLFADSRSKREKNTSQQRQPHHTEEAFVAPIRQSIVRSSTSLADLLRRNDRVCRSDGFMLDCLSWGFRRV